ncbi:MAG: NAD(P)-dependent oxidoreductase [Candidatus Eisenbacteria bacterium]
MSGLVLLTGATGFAGSHVLEALLASGYRVRIPVRPTSNLHWIPDEGVERVTADLRDPAGLAALTRGVSWIFHFGGVTRVPKRGDYDRVNNRGTQDLYRAACAAGEGPELFLFCSSLAAGGPSSSAASPRREEDPPAPISPYGRSKLDAERWLEQQHPPPSTRLLIVRPPAVYGPRDRAVLTLVRWASRGVLPLPAPRGSLVSLIHARDLASACLFLAEGGHRGVFHATDGVLHSWENVGETLAPFVGRRLHSIRIPAPLVWLAGMCGEVVGTLGARMPVVNRDKVRDILRPYWTASCEKLAAAGFRPRIDLEEGLRETVEWYRAQKWLRS